MADAIFPCVWFNADLDEALAFYREIFPGLRVAETMPTPPGTPTAGPGRLLVATVEMAGLRLQLLNGGPEFALSSAVSLVVPCDTQAEVDHYWNALLAGGAPQQCGWLTDRFGLSWQIVPKALPRMLADPDRAAAERAMQAMLGMVKLDLPALERAYAGQVPA